MTWTDVSGNSSTGASWVDQTGDISTMPQWGIDAVGFCPRYLWDDALNWNDLEIWGEGPQWTTEKTADPTDGI